jgi:queuine tRNA-ribosyltransferase
VLDIQAAIGSDIAMVLDDCPPIEATEKRVKSAIIRTREWAQRSINYWQERGMGKEGRAIFGIIQGGLFEEFRKESLNDIQNLPFDGIAIGGVAIASEGKEKINKAVEYIASDLDPSRPHYLMGVGEPEDLIRMVHKGMDMFDCVLPTRLARHGTFWTKDFNKNDIRNARFTKDEKSLDPECDCKMCQNFSRSYLRHLFMTSESFAMRALSYHNLYFILRLMEDIRESIEADTFTEKYARYLSHY